MDEFSSTIGQFLGTLLGILIPLLGYFGRTSWRKFRIKYDSGETSCPANVLVPTPEEFELIQRLRLQGTVKAPTLSSISSGRTQRPSLLRPVHKTTLRLPGLRVGSEGSRTAGSSIETSPVKTISELGEPEDKVSRDTDCQAGPGLFFTVSTEIQTECAVESRTSQTVDTVVATSDVQTDPIQTPIVVDYQVQVCCSTQSIAAQTVPATTPTPSEAETTSVGTQTYAVGAIGRWHLFVHLVRRISFLRRTRYCLGEYLKDYNGIYTRTVVKEN